MSAMQDSLYVASMYIRMVWRFRWIALLLAGVVAVILWGIVLILPNKYEVTTKVYLDTDSLLKPLLRGLAVNTDQHQRTVQLISRTLLIRPNLEAVARKTDMDLKAATPKAFEALITGLGKRISVVATKGRNIFVIRFADKDPKLAYRVVEALLNILVERSLGEKRKDSSSTRQFIEEQIKDYEARLLAAEARLKEFKRRNVGLMPSDGRGYYGRLEQLNLQVSEANLQLNEARRRVESITAQLKGVPAYFKPAPGQRLNNQQDPLVGRIAASRQELERLLLRYTERHPDVVATRSVLDGMEAELNRRNQPEPESADVENDGRTVAALPNPLYQELKLSQGEASAEVAALEARVAEYEKRQEELKKLVDTVPKVEAELVRLNRDYDVDQNNYDELVQRREALKISNDASQTTDDVRFNILEPPREPLTPVSPNRSAMSAGAFVLALGIGLGAAFLIGLLRPAFYTKRDFSDITNAPVLGNISRVWTPEEMRRRRFEVATYAVGCLALVLMFGAVMAAHTVYVDEVLNFDATSKFETLKSRLL
jgi:polysaccharide chain length determinant protein (PEP-CTERM system associated)